MTRTFDSPATTEPAPPRAPSASYESHAPAAAPRHDDGRARRVRRLPTVLVLVGGLVVASLTRGWAVRIQESAARTGPYAEAVGAGGASGNAALGSLDSFTLALLLGGLRGPLVMYLWASSESQKNERDLEDFDTKVELIRLLQPEFDSVLIFQMWNKAYNISAQLASLPRKYSAILDAVDYGRKADAARPNNINITMSLQQLFSNKLGQATTDKNFYIRQVRADTQHRPGPIAQPRAGVARERLDPILDPRGNLLPELYAPRRARPADLETRVLVPAAHAAALPAAASGAGVTIPAGAVQTATNGDQVVTLPEDAARSLAAAFGPPGVRYDWSEWNDGSELQYLKPYEPFPYGVSPLAIGYNYAKRAQVLLTVGKQKPAQLSASVVDRQPALELKQWGEEEWERATRLELAAFGKEVPSERPQMELPTADLPVGTPAPAPEVLEPILFGYRMMSRLGRDARAEYGRHLGSADEFRFQEYGSHVDTVNAGEHLAAGDHDYLTALATPPGAERDRLLRGAAGHYDRAVSWYRYLDLRFYVPVEALNPFLLKGQSRLDLARTRDADPKALDAIYSSTMALLEKGVATDANAHDRNDYRPYQQRAERRLAQIAKALGDGVPTRALPPPTAPVVDPIGPAGPALPATANPTTSPSATATAPAP